MRIRKDSHITGATIVRILALVCTVIATVSGFPTDTQAVNSTTGKEFWYFANNLSLSGHVDHVSITQLEFADVNYTLATLQALPPDVKAIVGAPILDLCSLRPDWSQRWSEMSAAVAPYMSKVAAFGLTDEPDLRATSCFSGPDAFVQMYQLIAQASAIVKGTFPAAKTWVNYGTQFAGATLPQNVDWNSFDCYGPFDNCFGTGVSIPYAVDVMASMLPNPQTQSIFLMADASCFFYDVTGRKTHESELYLRAFQYQQLAVTHPRIKGLIGFIWQGHGPCTELPPNDTIHDISDSPGLADLYRYLGLNILTGAIPSISTLSVAPECVIPVGASTCTVNFGWTTISGPNVGVFGRLVGDQDAVFGPLCPGATSCALPAGVGDYILELRENWWDVNSKLIHALPVEVRHGSGAPTGQITSTPSICKKIGGHCLLALTANVQNAPSASFSLPGGTESLCPWSKANLCAMDGALLPAPGPHVFTVQLRANAADPNSVLDQRTFSVTVTQ